MLARTALGTVLRGAAPIRVLFIGISTAFVGALLLILAHAPAIAALGVFLLGTGFAPTFPVVLAFVGDRYAQLSGTAFSVVMVMALTGGMILPYLTGVLGTSYGLRGSFVIVPVALVLLSALLGIAARRLAPATQLPTTAG